MDGVKRRPDGKFDAWHMNTKQYLGVFVSEWEAMRASAKGTDVDGLLESMMRDDLFSDDQGKPLKTSHIVAEWDAQGDEV